VKDIPKPWFYEACEAPADEMVDLPGGKVNLAKRTGTDDLYFCQKVSDAGLKIMAHGGVLPVHMDQDGKYYTLPPDCHPCKSFDEKQAALKSRTTSPYGFLPLSPLPPSALSSGSSSPLSL